ncbi:MAG: hypothetical protein KGM87_12975 [Betaproteobacteria bacterium]|nr:hypothetical protein [Betaproteobacteria bacterium]MDE2479800.1 hypothetical protein [Betaproteobacteria bacterium]
MPTLLMCPHRSDLQSLIRFHGVPEGSLLDRWGREPDWLSARVPYLLGSDYGHDELDYCRMLESHGGLLCDMCQDFGGAATVALAELSVDLRNHAANGLSVAQAAADTYRGRMDRFLEAMTRHQETIDAYHRATRTGAPDGVPRAAARAALQRSGAELNSMFGQELALMTRNWYPRATMLVSGRVVVPDRVRQQPKISRLDVRSKAQAWKLAELATKARYLGRGVVAIDLGLRVQNVYDVKQSGGDWYRQAFVEAGGFAAGAGTGVALTGVTLAALELVVAATPAGWVLIVGGLAAAAVVAAGSVVMSSAGEQVLGNLYDKAGQVSSR